MALRERTFTVTQNEDKPFVLGYATRVAGQPLTSSVPVSFIGASATFTVYETADPTSTQLLSLTSGAAQITFGTATVKGISFGTILWTITHLQNLNMPVGQWFCDLLIQNGGVNTYYASGAFNVKPSVSR